MAGLLQVIVPAAGSSLTGLWKGAALAVDLGMISSVSFGAVATGCPFLL